MGIINSEVVILGAGVTGLAAGMELQDKAVILEKEDSPGGLVRTFCFDGYWFDNVVHLLHFRNIGTQTRIMSMSEDLFKPCPPVGYVNTLEGTVRYPFQLNLGGLTYDAQVRCLDDFYEVHMSPQENFTSYKDFLLKTFGAAMCEIFFFPYNEKSWKYPLDDIAFDGQIWNIKIPTLEEVLDGAFHPDQERKTYNSNGYYPRPPKDAPLRGMELLSQIMARNVKNLKLHSDVYSVDPVNKEIWADTEIYHYEHCFSTTPLPSLLNMCSHVPTSLRKEVAKLKWNKVVSVGLCVVGERPKDTGHWRYFTDPKVPFTKLIYMTEFDEYNAPANGYGLLIEIPVPSNEQINHRKLVVEVIDSLANVGVLKFPSTIIDYHIWEVNPAYVIFTKETPSIIEECKEFLAKYGITTLGRYGNWEYSSMAENIEDGFNFGRRINNALNK